MTYWEKIEHPRFFGRVKNAELEEQTPDDLRPLVHYLINEHRMAVEAIYLENYRLPEKVVIMNGTLPLDDLRKTFAAPGGLRYDDWGVTSDKTQSFLRGRESAVG